MKKKNEKKLQFPSIPRIIPEKLKPVLIFMAAVLTFFIMIMFLFGIVFYGIKIYKDYRISRQVQTQRQSLLSQINFWQSVATKYPGYKDAYFQMAVLEYQLGDLGKAKEYDQKALVLDPNYGDAIKLEALF